MTDEDEQAPITKGQLEAAEKLRQAAVGWIGDADAKATTIASVLAVVLGLVSLDMATASRAASLEWIYWTFLAFSVVSVGFCIGTLWPVTNRRAYVPESRLEYSVSFFGDVPTTYAEFRRRDPTDEDVKADVFEQSYVLARIANRKMVLVRCTIVFFILALISLAVLAFAATVVSPSDPTASPSGGSATVHRGAASLPHESIHSRHSARALPTRSTPGADDE